MGDALASLNVSRETIEALKSYSELVMKWTIKINLISMASRDEIWDRHIVDSAQVYLFPPKTYESWVDIGSGGGFPGIVAAIIGKSKNPNARFTLIESDQRKATFLRTAARELDLSVDVIADRIENVPSINADIVSARALTSLYSMMPLLDLHLSKNGVALLHKGKQYDKEVAEARQFWSFQLEAHRSLTDPEARLLEIKGISRFG